MITYDFHDQCALITGGTSGIGLRVAELFLQAGACVGIVGRNRSRGAKVQGELEKRGYAGRIFFQEADLSQGKACKAAVESVLERFGKINVVVNSAGEYLEKPLTETSESDYDRIMASNMKSAFFVSRAAIEALKKQRGNIVNVSSDAGINGNFFCTAYCASKGALTLFTKSLALEMAPFGIRVNCVCPGDVMTPMLQRQLAEMADPLSGKKQMEAIYPLGRIGTADEVAQVILFLATDAAAFV